MLRRGPCCSCPNGFAGRLRFGPNERRASKFAPWMGPASFEQLRRLSRLDGRGSGPAPRLERTVPNLTYFRGAMAALPCIHCQHHYVGADDLVPAARLEGHAIWGPIFHEIDFDRDLGNVRVENTSEISGIHSA